MLHCFQVKCLLFRLVFVCLIALSFAKIEYSRQIPRVIPNKLIEVYREVDTDEFHGKGEEFKKLYEATSKTSSGRMESFVFDKFEKEHCYFQYKFQKDNDVKVLKLEASKIASVGVETFTPLIKSQGLSSAKNCEIGDKWCTPNNMASGKREKRAVLTCKGSGAAVVGSKSVTAYCPDAISKSQLEEKKKQIHEEMKNKFVEIEQQLVATKNVADNELKILNNKLERATADFQDDITSLNNGLKQFDKDYNIIAEQVKNMQAVAVANQVWSAARSFYFLVEEALDLVTLNQRIATDVYLCAAGSCAALLADLGRDDIDLYTLMGYKFDFKINVAIDKESGKLFINYYKPADYSLTFSTKVIEPVAFLTSGCRYISSQGKYKCEQCYNQPYNESISSKSETHIKVQNEKFQPCFVKEPKKPLEISTKIGCVSVDLTPTGFEISENSVCVSDFETFTRSIHVDNSVKYDQNSTTYKYSLAIPQASHEGSPSDPLLTTERSFVTTVAATILSSVTNGLVSTQAPPQAPTGDDDNDNNDNGQPAAKSNSGSKSEGDPAINPNITVDLATKAKDTETLIYKGKASQLEKKSRFSHLKNGLERLESESPSNHAKRIASLSISVVCVVLIIVRIITMAISYCVDKKKSKGQAGKR